MTRLINDKEKVFARKLDMIITMMDNRDSSQEPLKASEYMVKISRDEYKSLCEYALAHLKSMWHERD